MLNEGPVNFYDFVVDVYLATLFLGELGLELVVGRDCMNYADEETVAAVTFVLEVFPFLMNRVFVVVAALLGDPPDTSLGLYSSLWKYGFRSLKGEWFALLSTKSAVVLSYDGS